MRVLLTADPEVEVPPELYGGIERIVASLATALRERGFEVALVARSGSKCVVDSFFPWPVASSRGLGSLYYNSRALQRAVSDFEPAVVHSFSRLAYLLPVLRSRYVKVMSYQRQPTCRTVALAEGFSTDRSLVFTGCSEHIASEGRKCGGEWRAIPNFVDTEALQPSEFVDSDAPLVFLSRVERIKGAHTAIRIAAGAGRRLVIAGNHSATPDAAEYWRTEIQPHIGRMVEYVGPVDDRQKATLLRSAAAMLVPIEWDEPFGIVFAEALACGTPVISSRRGALPEIVRDGVDGFLLSSALEGVDAVARIPEISRKGCRERAVKKFSRDVVVGQYVELYIQLASRKQIA